MPDPIQQKEMLMVMKDAGCVEVGVGVEMVQKILNIVNKRRPWNRMQTSLKCAKKLEL